jgi:hypothetical protein
MEMDSSPMAKFFQLSTRGLMILVLVVGVWLGWLVNAARVQRSAVTAIEKSGGRAWYCWQRNSLDAYRADPEERPWWPGWVIDRFGIDLFGSVVKVDFAGAGATDHDLIHVGHLSGLEYLSITSEPRVSGVGFQQLARLTNLRCLNLMSTSIRDAELIYLGGLENLEELNLFGCEQLTGAGLAHLKALRKLRILVLDRTPITADGLIHIENLTNLKELYLNDSAIGDEAMARVRTLTRLEVLAVHGCTAITDAGVAHLAGLRRLKGLALSQTQITDAGLRCLKGLKGLHDLDITGTHVTNAGVGELQLALPKLEIYYSLPLAGDALVPPEDAQEIPDESKQ